MFTFDLYVPNVWASRCKFFEQESCGDRAIGLHQGLHLRTDWRTRYRSRPGIGHESLANAVRCSEGRHSRNCEDCRGQLSTYHRLIVHRPLLTLGEVLDSQPGFGDDHCSEVKNTSHKSGRVRTGAIRERANLAARPTQPRSTSVLDCQRRGNCY